MSDEVHTEAHGQVAEPQEKLDPETRARREAALRLVRKYGDPVLRSRALEIERFDDALLDEVRRMGRLMHDAYGIGLAAPQVGVSLRIFVIDVSVGRRAEDLMVFVNPEFIELEGMQLEEEGCLSVPGFNATVARPMRAVLRGLDRNGVPFTVEGKDLLARAFQHEMDHLDGRLFLDRVRGIKRDLIVKKIRKLSRTGKW